MEVKYRTDLYTNYILLEIPEDIDCQMYSFKMIEKNRIKGVLPTKTRMEDGKGYLYLDVGNRRNLADVYKDKFVEHEGINLLVAHLKGTKRDGLLALGDSLKQSVKDYVIVLIGEDDKQLPIITLVGGEALAKFKAGNIVRNVARALDGSGGGRPDNASGAGKNFGKVKDVIANIKEYLN